MELNKYSKTLTQDETQPAARAMLYGVGLTDSDMSKAQVGIVASGYEGNTCNMHLNDLAKTVKMGVQASDLVGLTFHTIGVSDGWQMERTECGILWFQEISLLIQLKLLAVRNGMMVSSL